MEVSGQLHGPAALPPGKERQYSLDRMLGGPQSRSGCGGEEIPNVITVFKSVPARLAGYVARIGI
jgi:hypothetical protein